MTTVDHKFGLWIQCADCGGTGCVKKLLGRIGICNRCNGETHVPLIITTPEMKALLAGGRVVVENGRYRVLTESGEVQT